MYTPTPWFAEPKVGRGAWIKGKTGEWTALACGDTDKSAVANAQIITRAVNSYDKMVLVLQELSRCEGCSVASTEILASRVRQLALSVLHDIGEA